MTIKIEHHERRVDGKVIENYWAIVTLWSDGDERSKIIVFDKADLLSLREQLNKLNLDSN